MKAWKDLISFCVLKLSDLCFDRFFICLCTIILISIISVLNGLICFLVKNLLFYSTITSNQVYWTETGFISLNVSDLIVNDFCCDINCLKSNCVRILLSKMSWQVTLKVLQTCCFFKIQKNKAQDFRFRRWK